MHVACICTHLVSSASAASLVPRPEDRTRLLSSSLRSFSDPPSSPRRFSVPECCMGEGWERDYISLARLPQQLLEQHALVSLMSWAYSACVLLFQQRRALSRSILRFSLGLLRCLRGSLREHDCAISTIHSRSFTMRTSISTTS